jgi:hypothetical protein
VVSELNTGWIKVISALTFNLIICLISVFMLYKVKDEHKNKLGTTQELMYYFTKDRSLIFFISGMQVLLCCNLSAYALNFVSKKISFYICRIIGIRDVTSLNYYMIEACTLLLIALFIYLYTKK